MSSCARALASEYQVPDELRDSVDSERRNILYPNVLMIVGKNAEMDAKAQLAPKYIIPPRYIC